MNRIPSFIISIICTVLSGVMAFVNYNYINQISTTSSGAKALALIITLPLALILMGILLALCVSAIIYSIRAITSNIKAIRIISIFILIIAVAITIAGALMILMFVK